MKKDTKREEYKIMAKMSKQLAEGGYEVFHVHTDSSSIDLFALSFDKTDFLPIQVKERFGFYKKYLGKKVLGKDILIGFYDGDQLYLYPHDKLFKKIDKIKKFSKTSSWKNKGMYHKTKTTKEDKLYLMLYKY